jgi:hypothetical protein
MDLRDLKVGDLVKFDDFRDESGGWRKVRWGWLEDKDKFELNQGGGSEEDNSPPSNVGIVTQIFFPDPKTKKVSLNLEDDDNLNEVDIAHKDQVIKNITTEIRIGERAAAGGHGAGVDLEQPLDYPPQNVCIIHYLAGDGVTQQFSIEALVVYQHGPGRRDQLPGNPIVDKLTPKQIELYKNAMVRFKKITKDGMKGFPSAVIEGGRERTKKVASEFAYLINKYASELSELSGMSTRKKAMIGAAGLAGIGGVALGNYLTGGKKKKRKTKRKKTKRRRTKRRRTKKKIS